MKNRDAELPFFTVAAFSSVTSDERASVQPPILRCHMVLEKTTQPVV